MKSVKQQYIDLQEGRMSQANFMRNLRMTMPHLVTNVTSFNDSVRILKNKGILSEADTKTGAYNQDGASMYKGFPENTHVNRQELTKGIKMEHEQNPYEEYEKVVKKVIKNLKKDPNYYTHYQLSGVEGFTPKIIGNVNPTDRTMKFVKDGNIVDKAMGMKVVKDLGKHNPSANKSYSEKHPNKIGKIDLMSLVAQSVRGVKKMDATGEKTKKIKLKLKEAYWMNKPADVDKYQIQKDSKGNIIQVTNDEGIKFNKSDIATAIDNGEKIKISSFIEQQGKVKAVYIIKGTPYTIDVDGLEKSSFVKETFESMGNTTVQHAEDYIKGPNANPTLKNIASQISLQDGPGNTAVLKYNFGDVLPDDAYEKLELQFNVQQSTDPDEETGEIISYILTPKKSPYAQKDLGRAFDKFKGQFLKEKLAQIIREELAEIFDGRDNMTDTAGEMDENLTDLPIEEMRDWLKDLSFEDVEDIDTFVDELSDDEVIDAIKRHYEGGLEQFIEDNI